MKLSKKMCITFALLSLIWQNTYTINAIEPIMQEKYTIEEQKIKRAQFIWTACIEEMRKNNELSDNEVTSINKYIHELMKNEKSELPIKRCEREKKVLQITTVDKLIKENIIDFNQGNILKKKLSKYDLSNLEN